MKDYQTEVLVSITSIVKDLWRSQADDVERLGVKRIALFLTCADKAERQLMFQRLESIDGLEIPFVHARSDMTKPEYQYLVERFHTELFNAHPESDYPLLEDIGEYRQQLLIENSDGFNDASEVNNFAGFCLDISHLKGHQLAHNPNYEAAMTALERFEVKANHISAIDTKRHFKGEYRPDTHTLTDLSQLDYLKEYPRHYFGRFAAIELNNDIPTQLQAKKKIETIIGSLAD